ncbi:hypothetical protein [Aeropyrum camini]|nr:hypothetical protein [Aeropyrum camini]
MAAASPHDARYAGTIAEGFRGRLISLILPLIAALVVAIVISLLTQG